MSAEWVTAIATVGTFVVIAASAAAALTQMGHMRSSNQIAALNECRERIESPEFQAAERFVALELAERFSDPDFQRALLEPYFPDEYQPMRMVANFFESLGTFVKNGFIDRDIACDLLDKVILRNWNAIAPLAANRRVALNQPDLWENFEYLAMLCEGFAKRHPQGAYPRGARRMPMPDLWPIVREQRGRR